MRILHAWISGQESDDMIVGSYGIAMPQPGMTIEEGTGTKLVDNTDKIDEDVKLKLGILEPEEIQKYNEAEPKVCQKEVTKQKKGRHKKIDKSAISQPTNFVHVTGVERGTKMVDNTELMDPEVMQKLKMTRTGENQPPN